MYVCRILFIKVFTHQSGKKVTGDKREEIN